MASTTRDFAFGTSARILDLTLIGNLGFYFSTGFQRFKPYAESTESLSYINEELPH